MRYLALGDSYTIGTGASDESRNYPSIIAARLTKSAGHKVELVNPAVNGFTTLDLIRDELPYLKTFKPDLVTILIGVNDLVQGRGAERYHESLRRVYDAAGDLRLDAGRTVAISIPNWSAVPAARDFGDPPKLRRLTETFNAIAKDEAERCGFAWVDITSVSTSGAKTSGWISSDRLHPGDVQYAKWADHIWDAVRDDWTAAARS